jgi:NhaP-type Na+/H+ or K+/H+ antiporter
LFQLVGSAFVDDGEHRALAHRVQRRVLREEGSTEVQASRPSRRRLRSVRVKFCLLYGIVLGVSALISERSRRTALSTAVLFLVVGYVFGRGGFELISFSPSDEAIEQVAKLALFTLLFVEGCKLSLGDLKGVWRLPTRAIWLGMPVTIGGIALASHVMLGFEWLPSLLIAAILSPTDPVFAAALLQVESVPLRVRRLLGIESGLNDGLALPIVMVLLAVLGHQPVHGLTLAVEVLGGVALGAIVPAAFHVFERTQVFAVSREYCALFGLAIAFVVFAAASQLHVNEYLAAYTAGVSLATLASRYASATTELGDPIAEAIKLAAVLAFAAVLTAKQFVELGWRGWCFIAITLLCVRPLALSFALVRRSLTPREWLAVSWFGPKGFASIVYASLMVQHRVPQAVHMFDVITAVTAVSIVAHSSTDILVVSSFERQEPKQSAA